MTIHSAATHHGKNWAIKYSVIPSKTNYAQKNTHKLESLFFPVLTVEKRESGISCQVNERINMLYRLIGETKSQKFMYLFLHQKYKNLCRHSQNQ